jgi:hypothetical protein
MRSKLLIVLGLLVIGLALSLTACQTSEPCPECPEPTACPEQPTAEPCPECEVCPEPVVANVPFEAEWAASGHADATAEAFRHWDEDGAVEADCATCHSPSGYQDFLGADGSATGTIENTHAVSNGLTCVTCHNSAATSLASVVFPSGVEVTNVGETGRCMVCHQGRASGLRVETAITDAGLAESLDTVSGDLRFINIHYYAAAATLYGSVVNGGYQYAGQIYEGQNRHVEGFESCTDCHNSHTLEVKVELCAECHSNVDSLESLQTIRMGGSLVDYDGDGNVGEGIADEIKGLQNLLLVAMQSYSSELAGAQLGYRATAYPYFFNDLNANGEVDDDEAISDNGFASWTARLLRAAYNYQTSLKDTGAFVHNPKYTIQLLHDSIADLNTVLAAPLDLTTAVRNDAGHFDGTTEAFRHWDEDGEVEVDCARCHSADGLPTFLAYEANIGAEISNGFACSTCHDVENFPALYAVDGATFPSGASISFGEGNPSNLCISCHQGRASTVSVNRATGDFGDDEVSDKLRFNNPHYFAAGATMFGTVARGAYEYDGVTYIGASPHIELGSTCATCHDVHSLTLNMETCNVCHPGVDDVTTIRMTVADTPEVDYDGDMDVTEGIASEIATLEDALLVAIKDYAQNTAGAPIGYDAHQYPYFFGDTNANGVFDADEGAYTSWTPNLLRAAYNYQWVQKDPGAYAHNGLYIIQVLFDSLANIGADVNSYTRP